MSNTNTNSLGYLPLSSDLFGAYFNGQAMIVCEPRVEGEKSIPGYIWRGEVADIKVVGDGVVVNFVWLAKSLECHDPKNWTIEPGKTDHQIDPKNGWFVKLNAAEFGAGDKSPFRDALLFNPGQSAGDIVVFFPKDGDKLDRKKVKGLDKVA